MSSNALTSPAGHTVATASIPHPTTPPRFRHSPRDKSQLKEWVDQQGGRASLAYIDMGSRGYAHMPEHWVALRISWHGFPGGYATFAETGAGTKKEAEQK